MWRGMLLFIVVTTAIGSLSPFLFEYGWNHGVVAAVEGVRPIGYWQAVYIESALTIGSLVGGLITAIWKIYATMLQAGGIDRAAAVLRQVAQAEQAYQQVHEQLRGQPPVEGDPT